MKALPVVGWVISSIVGAVLGTIFAIIIGSLNKKVVRDRFGKIDFKKSNIYFHWTRWDTIMVISSAYTMICIVLLLIFLLRGDTINSSIIQFFIHQSLMFSFMSFSWLISRIAYTMKGIKERWSDEI